MKANPIVWFEIYVEDMVRAKRFYEDVFEATLQKLDSPLPGLEMWQFPADLNSNGASGALVKAANKEMGGNGTVVYFHCDDCAAEELRVTKFGGRVERAKSSIGEYGNISLVYDTEGNMIGLHST